MSNNVRNYRDSQIIDRIESLETFKGWKKGKYFVAISSDEDDSNEFDDKFYLFEVFKDGGLPVFFSVAIGTANSGKQGLLNFESNNKLGCAVSCKDVIVYESHIYGLHGKTKYPAYIQSYTVGFPYTRDNDKDLKAENYGKIYYDRIGINIHKAGENTAYVNGNSVGCWVFKRSQDFDKFMKWANKQPMNVANLKEF